MEKIVKVEGPFALLALNTVLGKDEVVSLVINIFYDLTAGKCFLNATPVFIVLILVCKKGEAVRILIAGREDKTQIVEIIVDIISIIRSGIQHLPAKKLAAQLVREEVRDISVLIGGFCNIQFPRRVNFVLCQTVSRSNIIVFTDKLFTIIVRQIRGGNRMCPPRCSGAVLFNHAVQGGVLIDRLVIRTAVAIVSTGNNALERNGIEVGGGTDMGKPALGRTAETIIFLQGDKIRTVGGHTFLNGLDRATKTVKVLDVINIFSSGLVEKSAGKDIILAALL